MDIEDCDPSLLKEWESGMDNILCTVKKDLSELYPNVDRVHTLRVHDGVRRLIETMGKVDELSAFRLRFVSLLHDVVGNTDETVDSLMFRYTFYMYEIGLPTPFINSVFFALNAITKNSDESCKEYLIRVTNNETARIVKFVDVQENLSKSFINKMVDGERETLTDQYTHALKVLVDGPKKNS